MKQPDYPKTLELYRDGMLCLTVDVEEASKLRIVENEKLGPKHIPYTEAQRARLIKIAPAMLGNTQGAI